MADTIVKTAKLPESTKIFTTTVEGEFTVEPGTYKAGQSLAGTLWLYPDFSSLDNYNTSNVFIQQQWLQKGMRGSSEVSIQTTCVMKNGSSPMVWAVPILVLDTTIDTSTIYSFCLNVMCIVD